MDSSASVVHGRPLWRSSPRPPLHGACSLSGLWDPLPVWKRRGAWSLNGVWDPLPVRPLRDGHDVNVLLIFHYCSFFSLAVALSRVG